MTNIISHTIDFAPFEQNMVAIFADDTAIMGRDDNNIDTVFLNVSKFSATNT